MPSLYRRALRALERKARLQLAVSQGLIHGYNCKFVGSQYFGSEPSLIEIGDNCVVADSNMIASVPGKVICTVDEYFEKNKMDIINFSLISEQPRAAAILANVNGQKLDRHDH